MGKIPKQNQKDASKADEMLAKIAAGEDPNSVIAEETGEPTAEPVKEPTVEPKPPKPPEPPVQKVEPPVVKPPEPTVEPPKPPEPVVPNALEARMTELEAELEAEKQKNSINQGRHEADMKKLQDQIDERDDIISEFEEAQGAEASKALFSEDQLDELGPGYIEAFHKVAQAQVKEALAKNDAKWQARHDGLVTVIDDMRESTQKNNGAVFGDRILAGLDLTEDKLIELNNSAGFGSFLSQSDGYSGQTIEQSLNQALKSQDVKRTIRIYKTYLDAQVAESTPPPAELPVRVSGGAESQVNSVTPTNLTHEDIARMFASGEITKAQMIELQKQADAQFEQAYQDGTL